MWHGDFAALGKPSPNIDHYTQNRILVKIGRERMLVTVARVTNITKFRYQLLDQFPVPISQSDSSDQPK